MKPRTERSHDRKFGQLVYWVRSSMGHEPEAAAGTIGETLDATFGPWHEWALRHRDFILGGKPGITAEEYGTAT
jgi:hypothetical protein